MKCSVYACYEPVKARHLCPRHYSFWQHHRSMPPHDDNAGERSLSDDPVVCLCYKPTPDQIGECSQCHRLVVTFAHTDQNGFRAAYPMLWMRAEQLGLVPHE